MVFDFLNKAVNKIKGERILYYPGCLTSFKYTKFVQNYKSMLHDAGISFITIDELKCCGSPLLNAGYVEEFKAIKRQNEEILQKNGITKIVTNCSHCFKCFRKSYGLEVEHISQSLDAKKYKTERENGVVAYHDPCPLIKEGITQEPRNLLKRKGFEIKESNHTKEYASCCGVCGGLKQNNPELAAKIAKKTIHNLKADTIITSCPYCFSHLTDCLEEESNKRVLELSEALFNE